MTLLKEPRSSSPDLGQAYELGPEKQKAETFRFSGATVIRSLSRASGVAVESSIKNVSAEKDARAAFEQSYLRSKEKPTTASDTSKVRVVDLFCGAGGMSLGIDEACRALGLRSEHVFASDINEEALATYRANFSPASVSGDPIEVFLDRRLGAPLSSAEKKFSASLGNVDLLVGGPPCQGHSNLNNHTRRDDPKNSLYDRMARFAEVVRPTHLIIENVPGVKHDIGGVYDRTISKLAKLGYSVACAKVEANDYGVPQRRHRELVVASLSPAVSGNFFSQLNADFGCPERSVSWAIEDLLDIETGHPIDAVTTVSKESQKRINWLFDNDQYDLPDRYRPDCHRLNDHSYKSVYGRLFWDKPAWTITTGFQVMGQGRFLHPLRRRVITSHEAARLQFIPDFFRVLAQNRKGYAKMIGNAVPSKLAYVLTAALLR